MDVRICEQWCLRPSGSRWGRSIWRCPSRPGAAAAEGPCVRIVPHRPAPARRRGHDPGAAALARPPDRRERHRRRHRGRDRGGRDRDGRGGRDLRRAACRRPVARIHLRRLRLLPQRPGEPLRARRFTGRDIDGGMADLVADERFCFAIPDGYPDLQAAPLLCAGLIGHRAYRMAGRAAPGHLRVRRRRPHHRPGGFAGRPHGLRIHPPGRRGSQAFARGLGAAWAGDSRPPRPSPWTPPSSSRRPGR